MGLLEDLQDDNSFPKPKNNGCAVCHLVRNLPEKESKALQARLDEPRIPHTALSNVLKANNINISDSVMGRHRRGTCSGGTRR